HPGRSAYDHLWMLARTNDIARGRVDEVLEMVGLTKVARRRVGTFSLGMGQRLGIAVAMLGDPGVLLFDEPVNGLDADGIRWVRQLLRRLAAEGRTILVSSHLMSEMAQTAHQVIVIGKGRLIADTSVEEFTSHGAQGSVHVRSPQLDRLTDLVRAAGATVEPDVDAVTVRGLTAAQVGDLAAREGLTLHELAPRQTTLEEAFMESTEGDLEYHVTDSPGGGQP
ncbi:MAG: ATP-binding cassette domain-containing protein, partial [Acidimicrobiales bacterium]